MRGSDPGQAASHVPVLLVSAFDPGHDHTTDCNRTRSGADALGDGYPGGTDPIGVLTGVPAARGSGSLLTRRWRRQSRANPSLNAEFPASREFTGNSSIRGPQRVNAAKKGH